MSVLLSWILVVVILVCTLYLYFYYFTNSNLPPKVRGVPFLGIAPYIGADKGRTLQDLCRGLKAKYGDVFTIYMGTRAFVVMASYETIKESLKQAPDIFSDRPYLYIPDVVNKGQGIVFHQFGSGWKDIRKFTLQVLRDFGVGKSSLEEKIIEEIRALCHEIDVTYGRQPFQPAKFLQNAVSNIICSINFGNRFEYTDARFANILEIMNNLFRATGAGNPLNMYPWIRFIPFLNKLGSENILYATQIKDYIRERIEEHRDSFDENNIRDFIDLYLKAEKDGSLSSKINEQELFHAISDMFNAGTETTSTTLQWALLYLVHYPQFQKRVYEETEKVLGGCLAHMKDKPNLPYTSSFLLEVQRHATIAPMGVVHAVTQDTVFRGYSIPKGTPVLSSIWCSHRDEKHFPDPDAFNPDRWIDKNGDVVNNEGFIPFSVGPRFCLGEQLAKMELFLFFTHLVQTYEFHPVGELPGIDDCFSKLTRMPKPYQIRVARR